MTGNNAKLDLLNTDAHKKIGQILSICSLSKVCKKKMTGNNPKLDLVHSNFGQILSSPSQDIEWKRNSDVNQGP